MTVAGALSKALDAAHAGPLVRELFGGGRPNVLAQFDAAAEAIVETASSCGVPTAVVLVRASSGVVVGFDLADGGRVVVKVHRQHVGDRLNSVLRAQRRLHAAGLPVAEPLLDEPIPAGTGSAIVEMWLEAGDTLDVRRPALRRAVAVAMHDIV